jgi:hypothetical protein
VKKDESDALARYLDGELGRSDLPPAARREADEMDRILEALNPGPVSAPPTVRANVMKRVRALQVSRWRRLAAWVVTPLPFRFSPLSGVLAAAALIATVLLVRPGDGPTSTVPSGTVPVRFVYVGPAASQVSVTGEFAHWDPRGVAMQRGADGSWVAEVTLDPGLHHYVFVVDGSWVTDPEARSQVDDGFGRSNSVLLIPDPREI